MCVLTDALALVENQPRSECRDSHELPPQPCQILGVPGLLEQVFINLLLTP